MADVLAVFMRWLHIASVVVLIGGLLYGALVLRAAGTSLAADAVAKLGDQAAAAFRPLVLITVAVLVFSGTYNLLTTPGHTARYHIWLGIKLLLVLHVFASAILAMRAGNPRRVRMMASAGISGLVIILISAYLRRIF